MTENLAADIEPPVRGAQWALTILGRVLISILVPLIAFAILWQGFLFLRQNDAPKLITGTIAVVWGVGGVALIYWVMNWFLARLPERIGSRILPYLFVGPALAILIWFLALPTLRTLWISLFNSDSTSFVGLANYTSIFTDPAMLEVFRNNLLWLVVGTSLVVALGLIDRGPR